METHSVKIIDSTYSLDDAREIILSLITAKFNFINDKIFSEEIRFGSSNEHLKIRKDELTKEAKQLRSMINAINDDELLAKISCSIDLQFVPTSESEPVELTNQFDV